MLVYNASFILTWKLEGAESRIVNDSAKDEP